MGLPGSQNMHRDSLRKGTVPDGDHRRVFRHRNNAGAAVETYVAWVSPPRTHQELMDQAFQHADCDRRRAFDDLYKSMDVVASFGRMARFDYLTMVGKLGLAQIEPGSGGAG